MHVLLERRFEEIIASAFVQSDHDLSFQSVTFAEHEGTIIGMTLAYSAQQHHLSSRRPLQHAAGKYRLRMRAVETFLAPLMRIIDSVKEGDYYLQFIAVDKSIQAKGVGSILLDYFENYARANGSTRLFLDVSTNNDLARRFYDSRDWNIDSEWPPYRVSPTVIVRMTKVL